MESENKSSLVPEEEKVGDSQMVNQEEPAEAAPVTPE